MADVERVCEFAIGETLVGRGIATPGMKKQVLYKRV